MWELYARHRGETTTRQCEIHNWTHQEWLCYEDAHHKAEVQGLKPHGALGLPEPTTDNTT